MRKCSEGDEMGHCTTIDENILAFVISLRKCSEGVEMGHCTTIDENILAFDISLRNIHLHDSATILGY